MTFVKVLVQAFVLLIISASVSASAHDTGNTARSNETEYNVKNRVRDVDGFILVPISTDTRELDFYQMINSDPDPLVRQFFIEYDGVKMMKGDDGKDLPFMRLENVTENFEYPCIMKIRMVYQPSADELNEDPKHMFLFSILSYQYEDVLTGDFKTGSEVKEPRDVIRALYGFVNGQTGLELGLVNEIMQRLRSIESWFERQTSYNFDGSLIMIAYDAEDLYTNKENLKLSVKMYDFSDITPSNKRDENYLHCLKELIQTFNNLDGVDLMNLN